MTLTDTIALLCNEPFNLRPDEVGRLTLFQIRKLFLRKRDDKGVIEFDPPDESESMTPDQWNSTYCAINHIPRWYAEKHLGIKWTTKN